MSVREEIRKRNRLARMRQGQLAFELEEIPSMPGIRVAIIPLNEGEMELGLIEAAKLEVDENLAGMQLRNRRATRTDVWNACREPDNLEQRVWESPDAMKDELDPSDIDLLAMRLTTLMDYASPALASLSDEQLDAIKKVWPTIPWRELTGTRAAAARVFLSTFFPELLAARLSGSFSTENWISETEKDESTSDASRSSKTD